MLTEHADSSSRFKAHNVPILSKSCYLNRQVENEILEGLEMISRHPKEGTLLVKGGGGFGKKTLMSHLLTSPKHETFFVSSCNLHIAIWLNCFEWRDYFDEQAFVSALLDIANKVASVGTAFSDLRNMMAHFASKKLGLLFVFDDMFNAELLNFFRESCPGAACCVITQEVSEMYLVDKTRALSNMVQVFVEVPELTDHEIEEALKNTYRIKLGDEQVISLAKKCLRLPLIVDSIASRFRWCTDEESFNHKYQEVMKELEEILDSELSDNDKPQKTVSRLFQLSINKLADEKDFLRYCAFLTFNPAQMVSLEHIAALWGVEKHSARQTCELFERLSLLSVADDNDDCPSFIVHQMLYEATEQMAITRLLDGKIDSESSKFLLRFKLLAMQAYTDLVRSSKINSSEVEENSLWQEIFVRNNRHLLSELIDAMDTYHLSKLCMLRGNETGHRTFLHYLYCFSWRDDVEKRTDWGRYTTRHSLRLVIAVLRKVRRPMALSIEPLRHILLAKDKNDTSLLVKILGDEETLAHNSDYCQLISLTRPWRSIIKERNWLKGERSLSNSHPDFKQDIHYAVLEGDVQLLSTLCEQCEISEGFQQAITNASRLGYLDIVSTLHARNPQWATTFQEKAHLPLSWASKNGHLDVVKFLYEAYPDAVKITDTDGRTPLFHASQNGLFEVAEFLYEKYPDAAKVKDRFGQTPLFLASRYDQLEMVKFLYEKYAEAAKSTDRHGRTPLLWATVNGHIDVVEFLYEKLPDTAEIADKNGQTPFLWACKNGNLVVVKFWFSAKISDTGGKSSLLLASQNGHLDVVECLYEKYPEAVKSTDKYGQTPLCWASLNGHIEVVKFLYGKYPEAVKITDADGRTPLLLASKYGHVKVVKFLYEKYPEAVKIPFTDGQLPLLWASEYGHLEVVEFLYEKYPDAAKISDEYGQTPLCWASLNGHVEVVKSLYGKYPEAAKVADIDGRTPLYWASLNGHIEVFKFLYEKYPGAAKIADKFGNTMTILI